MKKLITAIGMLLLSMMLFATSTFAWFSMNKTATATGMTVKATADASLVIKGTEDSDYSATGTNNLTAVTMKPSTSYDGLKFAKLASAAKVNSAGASAATWSGTSGAFVASDLETVSEAGIYYATTTYSLKSISSAQDVYVKSITVTSENPALTQAVRVSITVGSTTLVFNAGGGTNATEGVGKFASSTWSLAVPTYVTPNTAGAKLGNLAADTNTDAVVNIWYEGQDEKCYSDNVDTNNCTIKIEFTTTAPTA